MHMEREMKKGNDFISRLCLEHLSARPDHIERCSVGIGNYVFIVTCGTAKYTVRCSEEENAYKDTVHWLKKLSSIDLPVPHIVCSGHCQGIEYIILTYIPGNDIGLVYNDLSADEKRAIARDVIAIQHKVACLDICPAEPDWQWSNFITEMLDRAQSLIVQNGYFSAERVERLRVQSLQLSDYFASVKPVPYLDDISTKNLLIENGQVRGIIDVDWMGFGDNLTFVALTCVALLNMDCDTDYITYLMEEIHPSAIQIKAFIFYCLMFCVDFMGERGTTYNDKTVEVNPYIIRRLNSIYERLWEKWLEIM